MKVSVLFFGPARDLAGTAAAEMESPPGEDLAGLRQRCERRFPRLIALRGALVLALNQELAPASAPVHEGDEVAFMPPVSGGR